MAPHPHEAISCLKRISPLAPLGLAMTVDYNVPIYEPNLDLLRQHWVIAFKTACRANKSRARMSRVYRVTLTPRVRAFDARDGRCQTWIRVVRPPNWKRYANCATTKSFIRNFRFPIPGLLLTTDGATGFHAIVWDLSPTHRIPTILINGRVTN